VTAPPIEWTVDAEDWRAALRELAAAGRTAHPVLDPDADASARHVRVDDESARVGRKSFEPGYADFFGVNIESHWLELQSDADEPTWPAFVVPFGDHQRELAGQAAERLYRTVVDRARERHAARARPVWHNHLLDWVEAHFVLAMFAFFFVLLPGVSLLVAWLADKP
jgi:hypothetical protein